MYKPEDGVDVGFPKSPNNKVEYCNIIFYLTLYRNNFLCWISRFAYFSLLFIEREQLIIN